MRNRRDKKDRESGAFRIQNPECWILDSEYFLKESE